MSLSSAAGAYGAPLEIAPETAPSFGRLAGLPLMHPQAWPSSTLRGVSPTTLPAGDANIQRQMRVGQVGEAKNMVGSSSCDHQ